MSAWQTAVCGAALVVAIGAVGLAREATVIQHQAGFTQLWLSARGETVATASLGVRNYQGSTQRYRLILLRQGHISVTWNLTLSNGQTWQRAVSITGNYIKAANLYLLPDLSHPYRHVATASYEAVRS